jgi:transposase-like protein
MGSKTRKKFTREQKQNAVDKFVTGQKSANELAAELGCEGNLIYRWRTLFDEEKKGVEAIAMAAEHSTAELTKMLHKKQLEIEEYQKKVAEQAITIDLLKKLRAQGILPSESELSGLIDTIKKLDQKPKRVK